MIMTTPLTGFLVTGADAKIFLQGQFTVDLNELPSQGALTGLCTPKGRMMATLWVIAVDVGFVCILPTSQYKETIQYISRYIMRAKVVITEQILTSPLMDYLAQQPFGWCPWVYPQTREQFTPHMFNLDLLGGISLTKGCYTGQEIVARTHYLGKIKRRLYALTYADSIPACLPATDIYALQADGASVIAGSVVDHHPHSRCILAVLSRDLRDRPLLIQNIALKRLGADVTGLPEEEDRAS